MKKSFLLRPSFLLASGLVLAAVLFRLLPHPYNFTPIGAIALYSGFQFKGKAWAYFIPIALMLVTDLILGLHPEMPFVYAAFGLSVLLGRTLKEEDSAIKLGGLSLVNSLSFFAITNFGVWFVTDYYAKTAGGLLASYIAALPFLTWTVVGDCFFTALIFGLSYLAARHRSTRALEF